MMMFRSLFLSFCLAAPMVSPVVAEDLANQLFGAMTTPSNQDPMPIGSYAKGCGAGMVELPESGDTWQAMRLSRNRHFGQPELVQFLEDLSVTARDIGFGKGLYIGDMSQPRGGPMTSGHASHQIGLDVDIWYTRPASLSLTAEERESLSAVIVRTDDQKSVTSDWTKVHRELLKAAALDPRVDRIFVAAAVKIEMCKTAKRKDKKWLQKIRPIAGHHDHFHVRLKCPKGASLCETQTPTVAELSENGDGCDDTLMWWVTDYLNPPEDTGEKPKDEETPKKKGARDFTMADLPEQCQGVLDAD